MVKGISQKPSKLSFQVRVLAGGPILNKDRFMKIYTLHNWAIVTNPRTPYLAPELRTRCLTGTRIKEDGSESKCLTTSIIGNEGKYIITSSGSFYDLMDVDEGYEKQFPNAKKRLFEDLAIAAANA